MDIQVRLSSIDEALNTEPADGRLAGPYPRTSTPDQAPSVIAKRSEMFGADQKRVEDLELMKVN